MEGNTSYALLQMDQDVKVVTDLQNIGTDGALLTIDIIGSMRGGVSKRIDVRYELVGNNTKQVLLKGKDAVGSKLGYNKITIKMGKNIARKVVDVLNCIQKTGQVAPSNAGGAAAFSQSVAVQPEKVSSAKSANAPENADEPPVQIQDANH